MTLQELKIKLDELYELKLWIETPIFQKYLCKPLREKQGKLKVNFFSDSLKESWRKGGKHEGIEEFFNILKEIDIEIKNTKYEVEQSDSQKL